MKKVEWNREVPTRPGGVSCQQAGVVCHPLPSRATAVHRLSREAASQRNALRESGAEM